MANSAQSINPEANTARRLESFIRQLLPLPGIEDYYFLLLRLATIVGGTIWYVFVPFDAGEARILWWLLVLFAIYSFVLYAGILRWPAEIRSFYLTTLGIDFLFLFILVRYVGELKGSFFIAFYVLVAIHSYYFGLRVALATAVFASLIYTGIFVALAGFAVVPWHDYLLRISFLFLLSFSLGLLAERQKQTRQRMEELNRELSRKNSILEQTYRHLSIGKLIGEIAEGINNPCGIMAARSELLIEEAKERGLPTEFIRGLEVINKASYQVAQVIRSLLNFSKQNAFQMKALDFNQLVEETLLLTEPQLREKGLEMKKELTPGLPLILGDAYELKGVVINLLTNAMDALPGQGGVIGIITQPGARDGAEVVCTITDNGIGIPEEDQEKIFNPFYTTKGNTWGIGLGLSMSLSVMKKHNGMITVRSKPGAGSAFSLSLPSLRP
ncbi:MAG: HAMP domain-containing histidine kinase [Deltaproteobacteria bacterium]|nr:HAMP domain-containing histidine kinase [Deltaproteobacteria bacterium]